MPSWPRFQRILDQPKSEGVGISRPTGKWAFTWPSRGTYVGRFVGRLSATNVTNERDDGQAKVVTMRETHGIE